jgi:FkbM family methyltransferase
MKNKTKNKRKKMLAYLDKKHDKVQKYQKEYVGPGFLKKIKRLAKFKYKYINLVLHRIFSNKIKEITILKDEKILINLSDATVAPLYYLGVLGFDQEMRTAKYLVKEMSESSVFYDVGGSYGFYTYFSKKILSSGEVHYFEPLKEVYSLLEKNIEKNDIFLNNVALLDKVGTITFYSKNRASDGSSFVEQTGATKTTVQSTTLEHYFYNHSKPDYIKLDAEGAEEKIIQKSSSFFEEEDPVVILEMHPQSAKHNRAAKMLLDIGYKKYKINKKGSLEVANKKGEIEGSFDNFIFKKST